MKYYFLVFVLVPSSDHSIEGITAHCVAADNELLRLI
jgi:hypothetical protein